MDLLQVFLNCLSFSLKNYCIKVNIVSLKMTLIIPVTFGNDLAGVNISSVVGSSALSGMGRFFT